jgi:small-conductance mechanosensitive channel
MLIALPAVIAVPIITGVLLGGPVLAFSAAVLIAVGIVVVAIQMKPRRARTADPESGMPSRRGRRAAALRFLVPLTIAALALVLILLTTGTARVIGWGVFAVAVAVAMSLVFLEIGYSEDRARARAERAGRRDRPHRAAG